MKELAVIGVTNAFVVMVLRTIARENTKNQANPRPQEILLPNVQEAQRNKSKKTRILPPMFQHCTHLRSAIHYLLHPVQQMALTI